MTTIPTAHRDDAPTIPTPAQRDDARAAEIRLRLHGQARALATMLPPTTNADRWIDACADHYRQQSARSPDARALYDQCDLSGYVAACLDAASQQLTPNGTDGWIVIDDGAPPRWAISWRGMFSLVRRAVRAEGGDVRQFCAELVYKAEIAAGGFNVDLFERKMSHRPWYLLGIPEEPYSSEVALVYAAATIVAPDGSTSREFRIITRAELTARERAAKEANGGVASPAWLEWWSGQARKTAVRAFVDWLPGVDAVRAQLAPRIMPAPPRSLALAERVRALGAAEVLDDERHNALTPPAGEEF